MSDYWKCLPRKFCDTCKCWFADNKASIQFHESGKRHQENVKKRITEIQKKGMKEFKAKKQLESDMEKIEKAALAAFKKDLIHNPDLAKQYNIEISNNNSTVKIEPNISQCEPPVHQKQATVHKTKKKKEVSTKTQKDSTQSSKAWFEAISDEGYTYYWNSETSESKWEAPEEGFVSLKEQNEQSTFAATQVKDEPSESHDDISSMGPMPKPDPYGNWVAVEEKKVEHIDLQLPERTENIIEAHIPLSKEDTFKVKEKTIGHLGFTGTADCFFKKRKNFGGAKRNVRQRTEEEES